jgi:hypothetical protein
MTDKPIEQPRPGSRERADAKSSRPMAIVRYVVPAAIVLAGAIVMCFGSEVDLEGGAGIIGAGLAVYAMNWLYRASIEGDRVRDEEEAARDYLDAHGHWPDERPDAGRRVDPDSLTRAPLGGSTARGDRRRSHDVRRPDGRR